MHNSGICFLTQKTSQPTKQAREVVFFYENQRK